MEEAKEELEAALLQAKNQCIAIQQQVWDHDKDNLLQGEDIYVKRFLYAVTVARRTRFYNGYRPSDVPRSKSLTRIFMEQRYHRSKSLPPSLHRQDRSEPKMTLTDSSDGVSTKIEMTETVEESTLRELIKNDLDECGHLVRKLPPAKKNWEHVHDVHLQVSDNISQKGAIFRMGEHLYGFDTIRDLSFQAADHIDKFFGRKPHGTLLYQSPYHFLHDYIEDYGRGFFKSSLSRSAHDLSEWRKQHLESPRIDSPLSLSEVVLDSTETVRPDANSELFTGRESRRPHNGILTSTESWASDRYRRDRGEHDAAHWDSISDRATYPSKQPFSPLSTVRSFGTSSVMHLPSSVYADHNAMNNSNLLHNYFSSLHSLGRNGNQQRFECNHHLVRDFREGSEDGTAYLLCDADVQPIALDLQPEGSIGSMTSSSKHSTADPFSSDQELSEMRSPFSTCSSKYLQPHRAAGGDHIKDLFQQRTTHSDFEGYGGYRRTNVLDGVYEPRYDPYDNNRASSTLSDRGYPGHSQDNTISHLGTGVQMEREQASKEGSEVSDADTLLAQSLDSASEATLVQEDIHFPEVETLSPAAELEESHLHAHVASVPVLPHDEHHPSKRNEEAELLLRDVHSTHRALQEEIDKYENAAWIRDTSHKEPIYDAVAADPKHIYDAVHNEEKKDIHHAHGAIVLSDPVKRPLAVSPPIYDEVADRRHPVEELHYAETDLSKGALYEDDENIYEEIRDVPKPSQEINTTQRHDYDVKELHYAVHPEHEKLTSDINSNVDKDHRAVVDNMMNADIEHHRTYHNKKDLSNRKQTPYHASDTVRAELVHLDFDEVKEKQYGGRINRELGLEHQIIRGQDEKKRFSAEENKDSTEVYNTAKPSPSPTFQRLQHIYTPEDVSTTGTEAARHHGNRDYDMNKYEDPSASELPKGVFDRETALATVAIRRMSKTNQWNDDEDDIEGYDPYRARPLVSPRVSSPRAFSPSTGNKWTPTATPPSLVKSNVPERRVNPKHAYHEHSYEKRVSCSQKKNPSHVAATFDERRYQGLNPSKSLDNLSSKSKPPFSPTYSSTHHLHSPKATERVEEHLTRAEDVGFIPLSKETVSIGQGAVVTTPRPAPTPPATPAAPSTPPVRRGFVLEMAKKYEQEHPEGSGKGPTFVRPARRKSEWNYQKQSAAAVAPAVPAPRTLPPRESTSAKVSVQEAVYAIEHPSTTGQSHSTAVDEATDDPYKRERMISMGTKESVNLDEVTLPRWSPRNVAPSLNRDDSAFVHPSKTERNASEHPSAPPPVPPRHPLQTTAAPPEEAEQAEEEPVPLQRNGSGRRSWPVKTYDYVNFSRQKLKMPDIESFVHNGNLPHPEKIVGEENAVLRNWNPRALVRALYEVSYEPRVETKRNRFISMEGHVEVPSDETSTVAELERHWKQLYMRTKEGRLQIFVSHCADEAPAEEIVLSGVDVDANREERTLTIHGGRDHIRMTLRVQSNVFDKWRHSLLSHAASSQIDAYVKPIPKTFQHLTERVVVLEIGSCSIRGGVLTTEPSLPQSFFPAIAVRTDDGRIVVGEDAYAPEIRHHGEFVRPIQAQDPVVERYTMDQEVVKACMQKVIKDLSVNPSQYKILLSIPQNIPIALIGQLLTLALKDAGFQGAAITRQPSLILYAYDVTTGVVVDIGDRLNIVPVIDGYVVESAICSIPYGATQVREALRTTLCSNNKGLYSFQSPIEKLILRYVLEQATLHGRRTSYVPEDYSQEEKTSKEVNVSLDKFDPTPGMPTKFSIDNSRFLCTEGLFRPKKWGLDTKGLHQLVHEAVQMSPIDSRRTLYRNIYLAGGASLMPGLAEKLEQELAAIVPNSIHTQVHISPWRYNAAYLGAQIVASASTFSDSCVSLENLPTFLAHLQSSCF